MKVQVQFGSGIEIQRPPEIQETKPQGSTINIMIGAFFECMEFILAWELSHLTPCTFLLHLRQPSNTHTYSYSYMQAHPELFILCMGQTNAIH